MKHFLRQFGEWFCVRFYFGNPAAQTAQSQQQHQQAAQQYAQQQQQAAQQNLQQYMQQNRNPASMWGGIQPPPGGGMSGGMATGMPAGGGGKPGMQGSGMFGLAQMLGNMMQPQSGGFGGQQQITSSPAINQMQQRPGMPQAGLPQMQPQPGGIPGRPPMQRMNLQ